MITTLVHVAPGGAVGSCLRFLVIAGAARLFEPGFPAGTLAVNVAGSFAMGVLAVALMQTDAARLAPFLVTGLLGGFTTFSAFSLDGVALFQQGQTGLAMGYVAGSVVLSLGALVFGMGAARGVFA